MEKQNNEVSWEMEENDKVERFIYNANKLILNKKYHVFILYKKKKKRILWDINYIFYNIFYIFYHKVNFYLNQSKICFIFPVNLNEIKYTYSRIYIKISYFYS